MCAVAVMCPNNQIYRDDLRPCGVTCMDAAHSHSCATEPTIKGCGCEDGLYLNDKVGLHLHLPLHHIPVQHCTNPLLLLLQGVCVPHSDCPCLYGGEFYEKGVTFNVGCKE